MEIFLKFICTVFLVLNSAESFSQKGGSKQDYDKVDGFDRKQGMWQYFNASNDLISEINYKNDKRDGVSKFYFVTRDGDSKIREEVQYLDGKRDGDFKSYYPTGETNTEGTYGLGKKNGKWTKYYDDGTVKWEGNYKKGLKDGVWKFNNRKGELLNTIVYKDGVDVAAAAEAEKAAAEKKAAEKRLAEKKKAEASGKPTVAATPEVKAEPKKVQKK